MPSVGGWSRQRFSICVFIATLLVAFDGDSATSKEIYDFGGGSDGAVPYSALVADSTGNLYGTTPSD